MNSLSDMIAFMKACLICDRIKLIQQRSNPNFVCELTTGYVVLGDHQFFRGYTLFLCKEHKYELHELQPAFREKFLQEMSLVASAVYATFKPRKLNYELLGNSEPHLHWHLFPRYENDPKPESPVWSIEKEIRMANSTHASEEEIKFLREALLQHIPHQK